MTFIRAVKWVLDEHTISTYAFYMLGILNVNSKGVPIMYRPIVYRLICPKFDLSVSAYLLIQYQYINNLLCLNVLDLLFEAVIFQILWDIREEAKLDFLCC